MARKTTFRSREHGYSGVFTFVLPLCDGDLPFHYKCDTESLRLSELVGFLLNAFAQPDIGSTPGRFFISVRGETLPKVEFAIQMLTSPDDSSVVVGRRLFIIVLDPSIDIVGAIEMQCRRNVELCETEKLTDMSKLAKRFLYLRIKSYTDFIHVLYGFCDDSRIIPSCMNMHQFISIASSLASNGAVGDSSQGAAPVSSSGSASVNIRTDDDDDESFVNITSSSSSSSSSANFIEEDEDEEVMMRTGDAGGVPSSSSSSSDVNTNGSSINQHGAWDENDYRMHLEYRNPRSAFHPTKLFRPEIMFDWGFRHFYNDCDPLYGRWNNYLVRRETRASLYAQWDLMFTGHGRVYIIRDLTEYTDHTRIRCPSLTVDTSGPAIKTADMVGLLNTKAAVGLNFSQVHIENNQLRANANRVKNNPVVHNATASDAFDVFDMDDTVDVACAPGGMILSEVVEIDAKCQESISQVINTMINDKAQISTEGVDDPEMTVSKAAITCLAERYFYIDMGDMIRRSKLKVVAQRDHIDRNVRSGFNAALQTWCMNAIETFSRALLGEDMSRHRGIDKVMATTWRALQAYDPMVRGFQRVDPRISPFGNYIITTTIRCDKAFVLYNGHELLLLLRIGTHNAFENTYELHFNYLSHGGAMTSKTFIVKMFTKLRIPGTVQWITNQTKAAGTTGIDRDGMIICMDELNHAFFGTSDRVGNSVGTGSAKLKATLETGLDVTNRAKIVESNSSRAASTRSKYMATTHSSSLVTEDIILTSMLCCFIVNTNDDIKAMTHMNAIASRFFCQVAHGAPDSERSGNNNPGDIATISSGDASAGKDITIGKKMDGASELDKLCRDMHLESLYVYLVYMFISLGIFDPVDTSVFDAMHTRFFSVLKTEGISKGQARDDKRYKILIKSIVITNAVHKVFFTETSVIHAVMAKTKQSKVDMRHLYYVQSYLYADFELSVIALTMGMPMVHDSFHRQLLCAVSEIFSNGFIADTAKSAAAVNDDWFWASEPVGAPPLCPPPSADEAVRNQYTIDLAAYNAKRQPYYNMRRQNITSEPVERTRLVQIIADRLTKSSILKIKPTAADITAAISWGMSRTHRVPKLDADLEPVCRRDAQGEVLYKSNGLPDIIMLDVPIVRFVEESYTRKYKTSTLQQTHLQQTQQQQQQPDHSNVPRSDTFNMTFSSMQISTVFLMRNENKIIHDAFMTLGTTGVPRTIVLPTTFSIQPSVHHIIEFPERSPLYQKSVRQRNSEWRSHHVYTAINTTASACFNITAPVKLRGATRTSINNHNRNVDDADADDDADNDSNVPRRALAIELHNMPAFETDMAQIEETALIKRMNDVHGDPTYWPDNLTELTLLAFPEFFENTYRTFLDQTRDVSPQMFQSYPADMLQDTAIINTVASGFISGTLKHAVTQWRRMSYMCLPENTRKSLEAKRNYNVMNIARQLIGYTSVPTSESTDTGANTSNDDPLFTSSASSLASSASSSNVQKTHTRYNGKSYSMPPTTTVMYSERKNAANNSLEKYGIDVSQIDVFITNAGYPVVAAKSNKHRKTGVDNNNNDDNNDDDNDDDDDILGDMRTQTSNDQSVCTFPVKEWVIANEAQKWETRMKRHGAELGEPSKRHRHTEEHVESADGAGCSTKKSTKSTKSTKRTFRKSKSSGFDFTSESRSDLDIDIDNDDHHQIHGTGVIGKGDR